MKNKTVNKKVLRAMSIGLAAMMTVQPVLAAPVFADETEPSEGTESTVETTTESSSSEASTESTSAPAPTVENVTQSYTDASTATGDIKASLDQAVSAGRDSNEFPGFDENNGGALTALNNAVTGTEIGAVDSQKLKDAREDVSDAAITLVEDAKREDKVFDVDADELLKDEVKTDVENIEKTGAELNEAVSEQETALDNLNNKIEITNSFTGTDGLINLETGKIESTTSIPAATESLEKATELKDEADTKFEQSKADYEKAAADYETAKADLEAKQDAYNAALNDAVADDSALVKAKAELETAQKDCDNLVNEINEAQKALSNSAIAKLAAALAKTEENANDWSSLDLIMKDVIKYYYFPSIGVDSAKVIIDDQFTKNSALADGTTKNERANYIKATVNGKVYYLNYICEKEGTPDDKISNDGRYPKMVIFEKNPELLEDEHYMDGNSKYDVTEVTENAVEVDENGVLSLAVDPVNGSYILNGTTYYVVNQSGDVNVDNKLEEGDTAANTNTSYSLNEDGDVVKTIKGDVTKTVIAKNASLVDSDNDMTLADAKAAAEESKYSSQIYVDSDNNKYKFVDDVLYKILENNELEKVTDDITVTAYQDVSDTYSVKSSAEATVDFTSTFTTTVSLKGLRTEVSAARIFTEEKEAKQEINRTVFGDTENGFWHSIEELFEDEKSKGVLDKIRDAINRAGYTVTGVSFDKVSSVRKIKDNKINKNYYDAENGSLSVTFTKAYTTKAVSGSYSVSNISAANIDSLDAIAAAESAAKVNAEDNKVKNADELVGNETFSNAVAKIIVDVIKRNAKTYGLGELSFSTKRSYTVENKREYEAAKVSTNGTATYGYEVKGTKVSKSYDTDATVSTAVFNTDELTYVDKKYAEIPLLNDNYYNYKNGKSTEGILADLGDKNSEIYKTLMKDVENANDLADKYEEARQKVLTANEKVKAAQEKVNALIESINALKNASGSEYEKKLDALKNKLTAAQEKLEEATKQKKLVDDAYERALAAYEDAVARLTPAPATGDEETSPAGGGTTTPAPAPAPAATLAGAPAFTLPLVADAAPAAGVAGARTIRGTAADSDSDSTADTTAKIAPEKEVEEDALAITKDTIKTIKDNETPLSSLTEDSTQKMNWWWLLLIALLGATGEEIYRRNKKKKEEEAALKAEVDKK